MIPPDQRHAIGIPNLETKKEEERFEGVESAVDKIAHEQVVGVWDVSAHAEEFHQVVELAVDVAAYRDRGVDFYDVSFFD